jgi:hypothetical protein
MSLIPNDFLSIHTQLKITPIQVIEKLLKNPTLELYERVFKESHFTELTYRTEKEGETRTLQEVLDQEMSRISNETGIVKDLFSKFKIDKILAEYIYEDEHYNLCTFFVMLCEKMGRAILNIDDLILAVKTSLKYEKWYKKEWHMELVELLQFYFEELYTICLRYLITHEIALTTILNLDMNMFGMSISEDKQKEILGMAFMFALNDAEEIERLSPEDDKRIAYTRQLAKIYHTTEVEIAKIMAYSTNNFSDMHKMFAQYREQLAKDAQAQEKQTTEITTKGKYLSKDEVFSIYQFTKKEKKDARENKNLFYYEYKGMLYASNIDPSTVFEPKNSPEETIVELA